MQITECSVRTRIVHRDFPFPVWGGLFLAGLGGWIGRDLASGIAYAGRSVLFLDFIRPWWLVLLVFVVLLCVTGVAYALDRSRAPTWLRIPLLLGVAAESGFLLVLFLTEVVAYAELAYAPAVAAGIVWMLCNLDLLKRRKKETVHG